MRFCTPTRAGGTLVVLILRRQPVAAKTYAEAGHGEHQVHAVVFVAQLECALCCLYAYACIVVSLCFSLCADVVFDCRFCMWILQSAASAGRGCHVQASYPEQRLRACSKSCGLRCTDTFGCNSQPWVNCLSEFIMTFRAHETWKTLSAT